MAGIDPLLSSVDIWPLDWAPMGWTTCDGKLLNVSQNTALFSLLGKRYGGNGTTTFGVPDLRGRVPVGMGGQLYPIAAKGGAEQVTLNQSNIPSHTHTASGTVTPLASNGRPDQSSPQNNFICANTDTFSSSSDTNMGTSTVTVTVQPNTGGNSPVSVVQPYQVLNYIIALEGVFPVKP